MSKFLYAAFQDLELKSNDDPVYSPREYQNYNNLLQPKESQQAKLKARFTISSQVKQFLTFLMKEMIKELSLIQIKKNDSPADLRKRLVLAVDECYTEFMWGVYERTASKFGKTLESAGDSMQWIISQISGAFPAYATEPIIPAKIADEFTGFLKAMAWAIGTIIWYTEIPVGENLFKAVCSQYQMPTIMNETMSSCLLAKPPAKPRQKKAKADAAVPEGFIDQPAVDARPRAEIGLNQSVLDLSETFEDGLTFDDAINRDDIDSALADLI
jgi:hypothetical protein